MGFRIVIISLVTMMSAASFAEGTDRALAAKRMKNKIMAAKGLKKPRTLAKRSKSRNRKVASAPAVTADSNWNFASFQLNSLTATQSDNRESTSFMASWTPSYRVTSDLQLRGNLGLSSLKAKDDSSFMVYDFEILARYRFAAQWDVEAGGGTQVWQSHGGANPILSTSIGWIPEKKIVSTIDRIFVGVARYQGENSDEKANELTLGFELQF